METFKKKEREDIKMSKTVNMGDKYEKRITLRLNEKQYKFLIDVSEVLGVSPSDYLRMVVNSGMVNYGDKFQKAEVGTHENVKTNIDNII